MARGGVRRARLIKMPSPNRDALIRGDAMLGLVRTVTPLAIKRLRDLYRSAAG